MQSTYSKKMKESNLKSLQPDDNEFIRLKQEKHKNPKNSN